MVTSLSTVARIGSQGESVRVERRPAFPSWQNKFKTKKSILKLKNSKYGLTYFLKSK